MSKLEEQLTKEIKKVISDKTKSQNKEDILSVLEENIKVSIYSHQKGFIDFNQLKESVDILLSIFYKIFPEDYLDVNSKVEDISMEYSGNSGTTVYFQFLVSRNKRIKDRFLRQSTSRHN